MFLSEEFSDFQVIFNQIGKEVVKMVDDSKFLKDLNKLHKENLFNEFNNKGGALKRSKIMNPFLFSCLLEKFKNYELGGLFSHFFNLVENLLHFYFMYILENPQKRINVEKKKTNINRNKNFSLQIFVSGAFRKPIANYLSQHKYICNIFLVEPRILFNINLSDFYKPDLSKMRDYFDKTDFKEISDSDLLSSQKLKEIFEILIKKSNAISTQLLDGINDDCSLKKSYKSLIKPLFKIITRITEINIDLENQNLNSGFLKMIMDCY